MGPLTQIFQTGLKTENINQTRMFWIFSVTCSVGPTQSLRCRCQVGTGWQDSFISARPPPSGALHAASWARPFRGFVCLEERHQALGRRRAVTRLAQRTASRRRGPVRPNPGSPGNQPETLLDGTPQCWRQRSYVKDLWRRRH